MKLTECAVTKSFALLTLGLAIVPSSAWAENGSAVAGPLASRSVPAQKVVPSNFRVNSQMVLIPVTVIDPYGKTIEGLQARNFQILDEQKSQQIASFSTEDAACSVGMVLDVSGSMQTTLGIAKSVASAFSRASNPADEFALLTVSTQPGSVAGFTSDVAALEKRMEQTKSGGFTALIDTVYLGLSRMREAGKPRRALLILSDGFDNHSRYSEKELMRVALEADVQIYSIIVDNGVAGATSNTIPFRPGMIRKASDRGAERQGPDLLEKLAEKTGGLHFRVRNGDQARDAASKAARAIREEYLLGYELPEASAAGKWHRVRVKLNVPNVSVHSRNGYYAP